MTGTRHRLVMDPSECLLLNEYFLRDVPARNTPMRWWRSDVARDTSEPVRMERLLVRHSRTYGATRAADWIERVDRPNSAIVEATRSRADVLVGHFEIDGDPLH